MEDLQDAVDKTPVSDVLLLLGDFNSRVGCSAAGDALWRGVRGRHGYNIKCYGLKNKRTELNYESTIPVHCMQTKILYFSRS